MQLLILMLLVFGVMGDDDDGQYRPDDSGLYVPDFSGQYVHDNSGEYKHDGNQYKHDGNQYNNGGGQYRGTNQRYQDKNFGFQNDNLRVQNFQQSTPRPFIQSHPQPTINYNQNYQQSANAFGDIAAGTSNNPSRQFVGQNLSGKFTQGRYDNAKWKIIRQNGDVSSDGYHWDYETENGISAEETGKLANKGSSSEVMKAKGFYKYTGPDNVVYTVTYTADENGFLAKGNHLPTPPPIPEAIKKSLQYNQQGPRKL